MDVVEPTAIRVLLIGDVDSAEMRPLRESLARQFSARVVCSLREQNLLAERADHIAGDLRHVPTLEDAAVLVSRDNWVPDLVIVCQHWPDEFPAADFERLLALLPLARWICCCGAWCESDGRNRDLWPLAVRTTARTIDVRLAVELAVLRGERPPLPMTASRDETFEFDAAASLAGFAGRDVDVITPDPAFRSLLRELVRAGGGTLWSAGTGSPEAVLWDVDPWAADHLARIAAFRAAHPQCEVVPLMGLAHPEDVDALRALGTAEPVTKLTAVQQLAGREMSSK